MKNKHTSAYVVCKNALIASGYSNESATKLAKRFSSNNASTEKSINKLNTYLNTN